jgi:hypothetical protein
MPVDTVRDATEHVGSIPTASTDKRRIVRRGRREFNAGGNMGLQGRFVIAAASALCAAALVPAASGAATFSNATPITINDNAVATPYPSDITVSGLGGTVTDVNVRLNAYEHGDGTDTGFLLQGPNGQSLVFLGGTGTTQTFIPVSRTWTFDDQAATILDVPPVPASGLSFKPTSHQPASDSYPAPGPLAVHGEAAPAGSDTFASSFNGSSPNGTWRLFARDFVATESGSVAGGWTLELGGDNIFTLGAAKVAKSGRSATLPGTFPGAGTAVVSDGGASSSSSSAVAAKKKKKRVLTRTVGIAAAGTVQLPVKPTGFAKSILAQKGKVRLSVKVTFTPTGGTPASQTVSVLLKKKKK